MKNLKKILVGFLVLVLLISSAVVLVVTAEEEAVQYTGDLAEAQRKFDEVPEIGAAPDRCRHFLSFVYAYLRKNPIDPNTEGYKEFRSELDTYTLMLADGYYDTLAEKAADKKAKVADVQAALEVVISYATAFEMAPGVPDPDGSGEEYLSSEALIAAIDDVNFNMMKGFYDNTVAALEAEAPDYQVAMSELATLFSHAGKYKLFDAERKGFSAFYLEYNELSVRVSDSIVKYIQNLKETNAENYYSELDRLIPLLKEHINEKCVVDFDAFDEEKAAQLKTSCEGFAAAIEGFAIGQIKAYFEEYKKFDVQTSTAAYPELERAALLSKVSKAFASATISEDNSEYPEYLKLADELKKEADAVAAVKEKRRQELESNAPLYTYEMTNNLSFKDFTDPTQSMTNPNADEGEYSERVTDANGNSYWRYVVLGSPKANYSYSSMTQPNITNGFVVSFDFMAEGTNGTHYDKATFTNEWTNSVGTRLVNYRNSSIFTIYYDSKTDSIAVKNRAVADISKETAVTNIAAEGQWFNVMFTYDPLTHYGKFYIDYEYMFDIYLDSWVEGATRSIFRISHQTPWQNSCYDNVAFYEGMIYRDVNRFDTKGKTPAEKAEMFEYFVDQFVSDEVDSKSADFAYRQAKALLAEMRIHAEEGNMTDEEREKLKASINAFGEYDYDGKILSGVKAQNAKEVIAQVEALMEIEVTTGNLSKISATISSIEKFIETNSEYIDKADKGYGEALKKVDSVKASLVRLDDVKALVKVLTQFTRTTSLASMTRRFAAAEEIYTRAKYDNEKYRELVENDTLFLEFEALINGEVTKDDPAYVTWNDYYLSIPEKLRIQEKYENSGKIITCIELLLDLEGYENTEEYWAAHNDEVDFYITIIRNIVVVENYDPSYPGLDAALSQYELVDRYFNSLLQEKHISIIGEKLDSFSESEYIEKVGICTYLDRYFENNPDIDKSSPVIQEYMYRLERYKAELESQEKDYVARLEENTKQFISIVSSMAAYSTYAELKPLYDNALAYYYLMNVDSDEAKAAIALFDGYGDALEAVEVNSKLFIEASKNLNIIDRLGVAIEFSVLSDLSEFYPYLDSTYSEEVKDLMVRYEGLLQKYNDAVISANNAADTAGMISASLRSNQISVTVLAVVNQLYKSTGR